jgi:hypothetical protein
MAKSMLEYDKPKPCQGLTFEQHKHFGCYLRHRAHEASSLGILISWAYGKTAIVREMAEKLRQRLATLKALLDELAGIEAFLFLKTLPESETQAKKTELLVTHCYSGSTDEEYQCWNEQFDSGIRFGYRHIRGSRSYRNREKSAGKQRHLSIEEHRHIARIVRCQIRQSALATQIIWKAYGTYAPATKEAYNWWRAADRLLVALDELSGSVKNLYYVELPDCQKTWYLDEIAADQLPLLEPLLEFYLSDKGFQPLEDGCGINISYP